MTIQAEKILFLITIASTFLACITTLWKVFHFMAKSRYDLQVKDVEIEGLQDRLTLSVNGLKEKVEHFSTRARGEIKDLDVRLGDLESFLTKNTNFEKRR